MTRHNAGCCREGKEGIDALGDLGDTAMTVTEHARNPARIGQPSTHYSRDLLANRTSFRHRWFAGIEMVKRDIIAERRRGGRKAADKIRNPVAIEKIALAVVLRMDKRIGHRHAVAKAVS